MVNRMNWLKTFFFFIMTLITSVLSAVWQALLFLIDMIDGGDDEDDSFPTDNTINYNHRTGDIDPVKRIDGLYDNKP